LDGARSATSNEIIFSGTFENTASLYRKSLQTGHVDRIDTPRLVGFPTDLGQDGVTIPYTAWVQGYDLYLVHAANRTTEPLVARSGAQMLGRISPDGEWLAYMSTESGRGEIYVRPLRRPGQERRVSQNGGLMPRWRQDGKELFFLGNPQQPTSAVRHRTGRGSWSRPTWNASRSPDDARRELVHFARRGRARSRAGELNLVGSEAPDRTS
jgi:hypothetical protein